MKCKVCDSEITLDRGIRGSHGINANGEPIPFWTVDPIKTPLGLAGQNYIGKDPMRRVYLKELQDYYNSIEENIGLMKTDFLDITKLNEPVRRAHIEQLRVCVEKILNEKGMTLQDYFCKDRLGNVIIGKTQNEWTDVNRSIDGLPRLPKNKPLRAIYIEELRRGIMIFSVLCVTPIHKPDKQSGTGYFHYNISENKVVGGFNIPTGLDWLTLNNYQGFYFENPKFLYLLYSSGRLTFGRMNTKTKLWFGWFYFEFEDTNINNDDCSHLIGHVLSEQINSEEYDIDYNLYVSELYYKRIDITPPSKNLYNLLYTLPYYIAKYNNIKSRLLGVSNGNPSQTFSIGSKLDWNLISPYVAIDDLFVLVSGKKWIWVNNFLGSIFTDEHFIIDVNGVVTFGNGINGKIPAKDSKISVAISLYLSNYLKWKFEKTYPDNLDTRDKEKAYTFIRNRENESDKKLYVVKKKYPIYIHFPHFISAHSILSNYGYMANWNIGAGHWTCYFKTNTIVDVSGSYVNNVYYGDSIKTKYNGMYYLTKPWNDLGNVCTAQFTEGAEKIPDIITDTQLNVSSNTYQIKMPIARVKYTGIGKMWESKGYAPRVELRIIDPKLSHSIPLPYISRHTVRYRFEIPELSSYEKIWIYIPKIPHVIQNIYYNGNIINYGFNFNYKIYLTHINGNPVFGGDWDVDGSVRTWYIGALRYSLYNTRLQGSVTPPLETNWIIFEKYHATIHQPETLIPVSFTFKIILCNNIDTQWTQKVYGFNPTKEYTMTLTASN